MLEYLHEILSRTFKPSVRITDGLSIMAGVAVPAFYWLQDKPVPEDILGPVSFVILTVAAGAIVLRLITAPYFIWKEDGERIDELETALAAPAHKEQELISEILARQKVEAAEEISGVMRLIQEENVPVADKKAALAKILKYRDKFWLDDEFRELWFKFHEACKELIFFLNTHTLMISLSFIGKLHYVALL